MKWRAPTVPIRNDVLPTIRADGSHRGSREWTGAFPQTASLAGLFHVIISLTKIADYEGRARRRRWLPQPAAKSILAQRFECGPNRHICTGTRNHRYGDRESGLLVSPLPIS